MVRGQERCPLRNGASVRAARALVWSIALCCAVTVAARAANRHPEFGVAMRGLLGADDRAGSHLGLELDLNFVHETGGVGARAVVGAGSFGPVDVAVAGTIGALPISGTYTAIQTVRWFALGPSWSFPSAANRTDLYALAGAASTTGSSAGTLVNTSGTEPGSTNMWIAIAGATWVHRLRRRQLSLEIGGEFQLGGRGRFWGKPPLIADGPGAYVFQTGTGTMSGVALHIGLSFSRRARNR